MSDIEVVYSLYEKHLFEEAFSKFSSIAYNVNNSIEDRADAFNTMGLIAFIKPDVADLEDEALTFFKKALEVNPTNIDSLLNIINCYGEKPPDHLEHSLAKFAINQLKTLYFSQISEKQQNVISEKERILGKYS